MSRKKVSIFGSTGCIGRKTFQLLLGRLDQYQVEVLTGNQNVALLAQQARSIAAKNVVIADDNCYTQLCQLLADTDIKVHSGRKGLLDAATIPVDWAMAAVSGIAGLESVIQLISSSVPVLAIANKESIICGGPLVLTEAKNKNVQIIPVDSEHNAIFQILRSNAQIRDITLTASGGPFLNVDSNDLKNISTKSALAHPTWKMGEKISIDSATMMNKAIELIEAYHLFDVAKDQISVLVHPESLVHGMVSYCDGTTIAVMSHPDMSIPISHSLAWPQRMPLGQKLDLLKHGSLTFLAPDYQKFPCLRLGIEVLHSNDLHCCSIVMNAANEYSVEAFLQNKIKFTEIYKVVQQTLEKFPAAKIATLSDVIQCHEESVFLATQIISTIDHAKVL